MDVDGWLINAVKSMYKNAKTSVKVNGVGGRDFPVEVGVHQGSVLSPLLFIIVMEALSKRFDDRGLLGSCYMQMIWCCWLIRRRI